MVKWISIVLIALVLVLIVLVLFFIGPIVKPTVTEFASQQLGVPVSISSLSVSPITAGLGMDDVVIANPPGYKSESLVQMRSMEASARGLSLFRDRIEIDTMTIQGLILNVEKNARKTNLAQVMENLKKSTGAKKEESGPGKKFVIHKLELRDIGINLAVPPMRPVKLAVPILELKDIGTADQGASLQNVMDALLRELARQAADPSGLLAGELKDALGRGGVDKLLRDADRLGGDAVKKAKDSLKGLFK